METGISVGGRIVNTIRYADDKAVVATVRTGLMDNLNKVTRDQRDMKVNMKTCA